ncbi:hypothetical protein SDC9_182929 [bioreactor metagenome]|uniref:Uncharacterized protein n=1 Tax=bioreactor metagenome TaxID=1076179 RepID=A0A645H8R5_9ZZZZ
MNLNPLFCLRKRDGVGQTIHLKDIVADDDRYRLNQSGSRGFSPFFDMVIPISVKKVFASKQKRIAVPLKAIACLIGEFDQALPLGLISDFPADAGDFTVNESNPVSKRYRFTGAHIVAGSHIRRFSAGYFKPFSACICFQVIGHIISIDSVILLFDDPRRGEHFGFYFCTLFLYRRGFQRPGHNQPASFAGDQFRRNWGCRGI